ncbi:MAG: hypothetical protein HFH35_04475 [Eubacterium sp.]|nr:hypothetical protein [Eubacterium sp.]
MSKRLNEDEIRLVCQLAEELKQEANGNLTIEENMQISLAGRIETVDEQKEVAEICGGIHDFDELLAQLEAEESREQIRKALDTSALGEQAIDWQYAVLAESLEALCANLADKDYGLNEFKDLAIKKEGEITQEDLDKLKDLTAEYIDQFSLMHEEAEAMELFFRAVGSQIPDASADALKDENEKYYIALAIYILNQQGKIQYIPSDLGARWAGIHVSACAAAAKARIDGVLGKISWDKVLEKLKKIASALVTLLVIVAAGAVLYQTGQIVFLLTAAIFGFHAVGIVTAIVLTAVTELKMVELLVTLWETIPESAGQLKELAVEKGTAAKEYADETYTAAKEWVKEEAVPALQSFWQKLKEMLADLAKAHAQEQDSEEETDETEEETEEAQETAGSTKEDDIEAVGAPAEA